ncbi:MAG: hypothetical protein CSA81_00145 [Acidobacteria bacterium]|nr:MAG: hypothetical protein CSA81_00145 [Acidobacteriota bacterium]
MKRSILIVLIVVVLLGKGLAQEANVLPLVLNGTTKADLDLQTEGWVWEPLRLRVNWMSMARFTNVAHKFTPNGPLIRKDANLESIAEHAENMRREQRLPAIPAPEMLQDGSTMVELSQQRQGIIEELEKAHIYVEQLHRETQELRKLISRQ